MSEKLARKKALKIYRRLTNIADDLIEIEDIEHDGLGHIYSAKNTIEEAAKELASEFNFSIDEKILSENELKELAAFEKAKTSIENTKKYLGQKPTSAITIEAANELCNPLNIEIPPPIEIKGRKFVPCFLILKQIEKMGGAKP